MKYIVIDECARVMKGLGYAYALTVIIQKENYQAKRAVTLWNQRMLVFLYFL